jgi:hypothetical protein
MRHEIAQSATSYGVSGTAIIIAWLTDAASVAGALAIILACIAAFFRMCYDGIRLWRYWRGK